MTPQERREMAETIVQSMTSMIGPTSDMQRSIVAAKVDGLIDARKRFVEAGWPEWLIHAALMTFITGQSTPVVFQADEHKGHDHG